MARLMDWTLCSTVGNYSVGHFWLFYSFNGLFGHGFLISSVLQFLVRLSNDTDVVPTVPEMRTIGNTLTLDGTATPKHRDSNSSQLHHNNVSTSAGGFEIIWNAPTSMCHKHGFNFSQVGAAGILQNADDVFRGDKMTILYDPGLFPAIQESGDRNGGLPQKGDIHLHLRKFAEDLETAVPSKNFNGIGVIDFEEWRPVFRQNWFKLGIYQKKSQELENKKNSGASQSMKDKQAVKSFEKASFDFFEETLSLVRKLRPKARWGYYGFPYCFNYSDRNYNCSAETKSDNDRSHWMWNTGNAVFPSTYIHEKSLPEAKRAKMIEGRTNEGVRVADHKSPPLPVYVYISYRYMDTGNFLSKNDMKSSLDVPRRAGATGVIIWGTVNDTKTYKKCAKFNDYVSDVLLPLVKPIIKKF